jgi:telomere length regulation protein
MSLREFPISMPRDKLTEHSYLIETYFVGQYSLHQRSVILTALAMGARELAGLTVPMSTSTRKVDFASKVLPAGLHNKYVSPGDLDQRGGQSQGQLEAAVDGIRGLMISKGVKRGEDQVPELAREKRLRVGKSTRPKVAEIGTTSDRQMVNGQSSHGNMVVPPSQARQQPVVAYRDIATEYFLMPMINRFWEHFNDSSVRETRAIQLGDRYRGAGTGMILSPLALEKFLMTLVLLVHAARHSNTFLAVISPEVLELAVAIGIRYRPQQNIIQDPISTPQIGLIGKPGSKGADGVDNQEGSVIAAALELALVSLDTAFDLDGGRTLATDKSDLLMAAGEWATGIFGNEEKGEDVMGGQGGLREGRIRAMSAGVVLKVSDIAEKWGRMSFL